MASSRLGGGSGGGGGDVAGGGNDILPLSLQKIKSYLDSRITKNLSKVKKMFCEIIYMHTLVYIYVSYAMLNNIFEHDGLVHDRDGRLPQ
jgi:hypothetical protein